MKLITGSTGLLGSEIIKRHKNTKGINSSLCNLLKENFYDYIDDNIDIVIHCAARVGGVKANMDYVSEFFDDNIKMNMKRLIYNKNN